MREFGFPDCVGRQTLEHPPWNRPLEDYCLSIDRWVRDPGESGIPPVAALLDAGFVAGDECLLDRLRAHLVAACADHDGFLALFARPVEALA